MAAPEERFMAIIEAFDAAVLGSGSWENALSAFADATGSRSAQLAGVGSDTSVLFNCYTNMDPVAYTIFPATVAMNPRISVCAATPVLNTSADADFISPREMRRHPFYQDFLRPLDVPFICMTPLEKDDRNWVALAVLRSQKEGHITAREREIFAALAAHARGAVRTQRALEGRGIAVLQGAMEALQLPVFICDRTGRIEALTPEAETLVAGDHGLQLKDGFLKAWDPGEARALCDAIGAAAARHGPLTSRRTRTVVVHGRDGKRAAVTLDIFPVSPQPCEFNFTPHALIVARTLRNRSDPPALVLQHVYGMTAAEADVARRLAGGAQPESIAADRCVSMATVRTQIRSIMQKVGVTRQVELALRLNQL